MRRSRLSTAFAYLGTIITASSSLPAIFPYFALSCCGLAFAAAFRCLSARLMPLPVFLLTFAISQVAIAWLIVVEILISVSHLSFEPGALSLI